MKEFKEFQLSFVGLKEGEHKFEYQIDKKFFDAFEYDEYLDVNLKVDLVFEKKTTMLSLDFLVAGTVNVPCDVTGEPFDMQVTGALNLLVKFGNEFNNDNEEVLIIPHTAHRIDLQQYIYEMIVLAVPLKRVSPQAQSERVESKKEKKEQKLNKNIQKEVADPRWEKLKDLLIDKNHHNGTSKEKDI